MKFLENITRIILFENHFYDEQYAVKFAETKRTATLSALFCRINHIDYLSGLIWAGFIYGGTKNKGEIGIRKVLGASVLNLWKMLSTDFIGLVMISLLITTPRPVAYYFMDKWLQDFPYHTSLYWWIFASAGAGALIITVLTVSYQGIKAALSNPVKNLRTE